MECTRRAVLGGGAASALGGGARAASTGGTALKEIARSRGLVFGAEVVASELRSPGYAALYFAECGAMTPGREAKWDATEPAPGSFSFAALDALLDQAASHGMLTRLHTLVWSLAMPDWANAAIRSGSAAAILGRHIGAVVGHCRGRAYCWDVVNEVTDPRWHPGPDGLTHQPWWKALGPSFVPAAFGAAREADPGAKLFLNDSDLEGEEPDRAEKRATYLRLISGWKRDGVPIDGFGLQAHLRPERSFAEREYRQFLRELAGMGLEIHVTEMDIVDRALPADPALRDRAAAAAAKRYLDVTLDEPAVRVVMTWGLSDRESWLNTDPEFRRTDGQLARGLPYDAELQPKPMRAALAAALAGAARR